MSDVVPEVLGRKQSRRGPIVRWVLVGLALQLVACGPRARPPAMARLAEVHASPAAAEAERWAPQAHAHALELEARAQQALDDGDTEGAGLLAERAIAAHEHAWVLTRLARAERRRLEAEAELVAQRRALDELRAQQQRLAAEAAALEARTQVVRSTLPLPPHEGPARERQEARRRAAGALSAQARLLCVGARLLGEGERVRALIARLDDLDQKLASPNAPKLLEAAAELRSECLRVISEVRRQNTAPAARPPSAPESARSTASSVASTVHRKAPAAGDRAANDRVVKGSDQTSTSGTTLPAGPLPADVLLDELSAAGSAPSRDERGVAVSLRDLLAPDGSLTAEARAELKRLGQVAGRHPDFPVLLVGHSASGRSAPEVERQLAAVSRELTGAGVAKIEVWSVGDREPLLPPRSPAANARNQRIELVFVAPGF